MAASRYKKISFFGNRVTFVTEFGQSRPQLDWMAYSRYTPSAAHASHSSNVTLADCEWPSERHQVLSDACVALVSLSSSATE
jgi:hypothetical protein